MMSLNDCAALCLLDQEDVAALSQFDHVPEVADATLFLYLASPACDGTPAAVAKAMIGDIRTALAEGLVREATEVVMALRQFLERNPQAAPNVSIH